MCQFFESSSNFTSTIEYPVVWDRFCLSSVSGLNHLARCNTVSADRQTAFVSTLTRFLQVFGEQRYTLSPTALQVGIEGSGRSSCCSQILDTAARTAQVYGFLYFLPCEVSIYCDISRSMEHGGGGIRYFLRKLTFFSPHVRFGRSQIIILICYKNGWICNSIFGNLFRAEGVCVHHDYLYNYNTCSETVIKKIVHFLWK